MTRPSGKRCLNTLWVSLALASIVAAGCSAEPPSGVFSCVVDSDCPRDQRCSSDSRCYALSSFSSFGDGGAPIVGTPGGLDASGDGFVPMIGVNAYDAVVSMAVDGAQLPGSSPGVVVMTIDAAMASQPSGSMDASVNAPDSAGPVAPLGMPDAGTTQPVGNFDSGAPALLANGSTCQAGNACQSGRCVDSSCCSAASCGPCQRCGRAGSCEAVTNAVDADSCSGKSTCDATGRCVLLAGESCSSATQCQSNACIDGVCCTESACGSCASCAQLQSPGHCTPVASATDPDSCTGTSLCTASALCATIDQTPSAPATGSRAIFGNGRGGMEQAAQIITVGMTGSLVEVRIGAYCWSKADAIVPFIESVTADNQPSGTRLATLQPLTGAPDLASAATEQYSFPLVSPLRVSAGQKIALVLTSPNATMICEARVSTADLYAGGTLLWTSTDNMPSGMRYYVEAGDVSFQTLMRP